MEIILLPGVVENLLEDWFEVLGGDFTGLAVDGLAVAVENGDIDRPRYF